MNAPNDPASRSSLACGTDPQLERQLLQDKKYLEMAEKVAGLGHWRLDLLTDALMWSDEIYRIHGVACEDYSPDLDSALDFYHPDDRAHVKESIQAAVKKQGSFEFELRIIRPDGEIRHVYSKGECETDKNNNVIAIFGVFQDITDRRNVDQKLKESEERYDVAVRGSSVGLWDWNVLTNALYWSPRFKEVVGLSDEAFVPVLAEFTDRLHPDDHSRIVGALEAHLKHREPYDVDYRLRREDGSYVWIHARGQAVWNAQGQPVRMAGSVQDISQSVALREELERQQAELQLIFDNVPARIWYKDDANRILRLNKQAADSMGMAVCDAEGANTYDLFPEMAKKYHDDDLKVINSGVPKLGIVEEYTPIDGERGWVRADKIPYTDPDSGKKYVLAVATDVTKEKETEEKLRESENRFSLAASGASVGIWDWVDVNEDEQWWSPILYQLFGADPTTTPASLSAFKELLHPEDHELLFGQLKDHFELGRQFQLEIRIRHQTKGYRWFLGSGQAIWDENNAPRRMVGTVMDIHDLKTAQEQLQERTETLERANEDLKHFAYIASHDLRAPLRGMDNVAQWIEEDLGDGVSEGVRKKLHLMRNRIDRMDQLLRDILEYSRAGQRESQPEPTDCAAVLKDVVEWVAAPSGFTIRAATALPTITVSASLLEQVLTNLVSNAVKHHDRDEGRIVLRYIDNDANHEFIVEDDGPGVPPEFQNRIFKMFQTLRRRDEVEGSGIGLAIVKKMVESAGGRIWIRSPLTNRGAAVHVLLPKHARAQQVA